MDLPHRYQRWTILVTINNLREVFLDQEDDQDQEEEEEEVDEFIYILFIYILQIKIALIP